MRLTIIDQTGDVMGGAQQSLEIFIRNRPADVLPRVVLFGDGFFANRIRELGVETVVVPVADHLRAFTRERPLLGNVASLPATLRTIAAAIRESEPDLVYTNGVKAHVLGSIAARMAGIASVVHHRDILTGAARALLVAVAATCSRARIATSRSVARAYPLPNTFVIENAVELDRFGALPARERARSAFGFTDAAPVATIVGRINRWKGIDRFIRAVARANERTRLNGLIVGAPHFRDADLVPELRALSSSLGLGERVRFSDWVDDTRLVYAASDVNVNASDREPFGRTIIEAAAAGVPSLCFDDAGVAETMRTGIDGSIVRAGDEAAFGAALESLAADAVYRERLAAGAKAWAVRFDATAQAERVAAVLRAAAGGNPRRLSRP